MHAKIKCFTVIHTIRLGKIANFSELYDVNKFCVLQIEILISRKNVTIPYYCSCKNLPGIVCEMYNW